MKVALNIDTNKYHKRECQYKGDRSNTEARDYEEVKKIPLYSKCKKCFK